MKDPLTSGHAASDPITQERNSLLIQDIERH